MRNSAKATISAVVCFVCTCNLSLADTRYVDISNPTPAVPYTTWATAANDIQPAVSIAAAGDTVLIADGTYNITSQIKIYKTLSVKSVNGPGHVIIDANSNCRVLTLSSGTGSISLEGLTFTGGYADEAATRGGGIYAFGNNNVFISNCIVENNESPGTAGGIGIFAGNGKVCSATVQDCIIRNNVADYLGGGIQTVIWGGASGSILIKNCLVQSNRSSNNGGGLQLKMNEGANGSITVEDCTINENTSALDGGGLLCNAQSGSINVSRCLFFGNETARDGGGVRLLHNSMLTDTLIAGNNAGNKGGGEYGGLEGSSYIINCTIVSNQAPVGGGVSRSTILNSIVYGNTAGSNPNITADSDVAFSCSPQLTAGVNGNINSDPKFIDPLSGNYRLLMTSPCLDSGTNAFVYSLSDLDGSTRIRDGNLDGTPIVDMGAYELQASTITIDIKPGSDTNPINLKSKGQLSVAIITTEGFDAPAVAPATVRFAGASPVHTAYEDVDQDGDIDLLLHFLTQELQLSDTSTQAYLIGQTPNGQILMGVDTVMVVPKKR
ncbi:hypothetical protein PDESU_02997 [Pontiella desulfatans]|uniref:Right handed beta helix domain-containing protein n=1 Tax=Pontiella desulfatans TaxID=2750659 RepID=A0A6C2U4V9_PONDE|nr:right-handed parallel beta-helix repeat-containing protein [Pontiella desulfatans]VGO14436.1 hypothetical protein PDESU_02997 [Pontiella desulfatans]